MKKTTQELIDMMKKSDDYCEYREANREELSQSFMKIDRVLAVLLNDKCLKKSDVIAQSGIEVHYAYQIFSGAKVPSRDKVVMLCFGFKLSAEESQQLLKITGYPQLYGKNERDNAILFGLTKGIGIIDMNNLLYDLNLEILI
ncbi:MAG: hypothetical protein MJ102_02815 [Clostridia bacterium]|nr:hypothetical protein [Clostridia bacterium]